MFISVLYEHVSNGIYSPTHTEQTFPWLYVYSLSHTQCQESCVVISNTSTRTAVQWGTALHHLERDLRLLHHLFLARLVTGFNWSLRNLAPHCCAML